MNNDALITAYENELIGYRRRGLTERAALVEAELRRLGHLQGSTPRGDVLVEPADTPQVPPVVTEKPVKASEKVSAPKRPTTRKKR